MNIIQGSECKPKTEKCLTSHCNQSVSYPGEVCGVCTSFARRERLCEGNRFPLLITVLVALVLYTLFGFIDFLFRGFK